MNGAMKKVNKENQQNLTTSSKIFLRDNVLDILH